MTNRTHLFLPPRRNANGRRSMFNAFELVVAVTVGVAVAALLVPLLYRGYMKSKITRCMYNEKQLGVWIKIYCKSSDGIMPAYENGWINRIAAAGDHTVDQTAKPAGEFACPSQAFKSPEGEISAANYWRGSSYGINQHISSNLTDKFGERYPHWGQVNLQHLSQPAAKVLLADSGGSNYFNIPDRDPVVAGISTEGNSYADALPPAPVRPLPVHRHLDGTANFLFADGHVENKGTWPPFMSGPGTSGYYFWAAETQESDAEAEK